MSIDLQQALQRTIEHREIFHDEMLALLRKSMSGGASPGMVGWQMRPRWSVTAGRGMPESPDAEAIAAPWQTKGVVGATAPEVVSTIDVRWP